MAAIIKEKAAKKNEVASNRVLLETLVYSVATSSNAKTADELISKFYKDVKDKFNFLKENFNFQIVCGSSGTESEYYGLAIQYILSEVRDWGVESIIKTKK